MAVSDDHIFHLASGTELSVEAARGDLSRVRQYLLETNDIASSFNADGLISDMDHVVELIDQLAQGYHAPPEMTDVEIVIGRVQAAHWDSILSQKTNLNPDRRVIYLKNIQQQLESVLKILRGEA